MIKIISHNHNHEWDTIVQSFKDYDVYYLYGYVTAFKIHGDGEPVLFYFDNGEMRALYVAMLRDIAKAALFKGVIEQGRLFDITTPYGYGGFVFDGKVSYASINQLKEEFHKLMNEKNVISNFVRFSPLLNNELHSRSLMQVVDLGKTIALDLSSEEVIWENIVSKNRNMIRKAVKNGVEIHHTHDKPELFEDFRNIYNKTMDADNAIAYYYFSKDFYDSIHRDLFDNYELFYATVENEIIAMSIMIFANGKMHYHLSCSKHEYRKLAPSNLLLYKAALWGHEQGFKVFHLGGGLGSTEDNLYKFKAAFNRNSNYRFSIGKQIFNNELYNKLIELRKENEPNYDERAGFFPSYRS